MTTSLLDEPVIGNQTPRIEHLPSDVWRSDGQEAIELAESAGLTLDPWQQYCIHNALTFRRNGSWAAKEVGLVVSRQNGKGSILEARELAGLFLLDEEMIIHSAHLFDTSLEAFTRILTLIESTPDLDKFVSSHGGSVKRSHGEEGITIYRDGKKRRLRFKTRTKGGGRGLTGDCVICDEAMYLDSPQVAALLPTVSARPNPQIWYTGSAGDENSEHFGRVRSRGISHSDPRLFFAEWSVDACGDYCADPCEEGHDETGVPAADHPLTPALVRSYARANPGLGIRISVEHCETERRSMDGEAFKAERLGVGTWPVEGDAWRVIDEESWLNRHDPLSAPQKPFVLAVDVTPDRSRSCIAVAGANGEGLTHVEVTGHDEKLDIRPGTAWVVPRLKKLMKEHRITHVVIDRGGQAGMFYDELDAEPGLTVLTPTAREYAQGCGWFAGGCRPRRGNKPWIVHINQPPLTTAVAGADKRDLADLWAWDKRAATADISPLVAVTLAAWGHHKVASKPKPKPKAAFR
ncbi:terminase [Streptomyces sp. NPDC057686]|uniref:terminase n=1 Tax=Streptomyces sp. NPDC057686 TaxID=3346212 RepID=UPI0036C8E757